MAVISGSLGLVVLGFFDLYGEVARDNFSFVANAIGIGLIALSIAFIIVALKVRNLIGIEICQKEMTGEVERDPPFTRINPC